MGQPVVVIGLAVRGATVEALANATFAALLRGAVALALGLPPETVLLAGLASQQGAGSAGAGADALGAGLRFRSLDLVNVRGNSGEAAATITRGLQALFAAAPPSQSPSPLVPLGGEAFGGTGAGARARARRRRAAAAAAATETDGSDPFGGLPDLLAAPIVDPSVLPAGAACAAVNVLPRVWGTVRAPRALALAGVAAGWGGGAGGAALATAGAPLLAALGGGAAVSLALLPASVTVALLPFTPLGGDPSLGAAIGAGGAPPGAPPGTIVGAVLGSLLALCCLLGLLAALRRQRKQQRAVAPAEPEQELAKPEVGGAAGTSPTTEEVPVAPDGLRTLSAVSDAGEGSDSDVSVRSTEDTLEALVRRAKALNEPGKRPAGLVLEPTEYARKQHLDHLGRPDLTFQNRQRALRKEVARKRREAAAAELEGASLATKLVLAEPGDGEGGINFSADDRHWWSAPRGSHVKLEGAAAERWAALEATRQAAAEKATAAAERAAAAAARRTAAAAMEEAGVKAGVRARKEGLDSRRSALTDAARSVLGVGDSSMPTVVEEHSSGDGSGGGNSGGGGGEAAAADA